MACDPRVPPRCRLRALYTQPGVEITGYGADDRVEVPEDRWFIIGRSAHSEIAIPAEIGGRRTFAVYWNALANPPSWTFKVNNEHAIAVVDGDLLAQFELEARPLRDGSVVEIRRPYSEEVVHRFQVELG